MKSCYKVVCSPYQSSPSFFWIWAKKKKKFHMSKSVKKDLFSLEMNKVQSSEYSIDWVPLLLICSGGSGLSLSTPTPPEPSYSLSLVHWLLSEKMKDFLNRLFFSRFRRRDPRNSSRIRGFTVIPLSCSRNAREIRKSSRCSCPSWRRRSIKIGRSFQSALIYWGGNSRSLARPRIGGKSFPGSTENYLSASRNSYEKNTISIKTQDASLSVGSFSYWIS